MAKYIVEVPIAGYMEIEIEADDENDAIEKAIMKEWDTDDVTTPRPEDRGFTPLSTPHSYKNRGRYTTMGTTNAIRMEKTYGNGGLNTLTTLFSSVLTPQAREHRCQTRHATDRDRA